MVLQNERKPLSLRMNGGCYSEVATLNGRLNIGLTGTIERHAESIDTLFRWCIRDFEVLQRTVLTLIIHCFGVAHFCQNLLPQLWRQQFKARDQVGVHLSTPSLQVRIGGEERVDIFHELGRTHV